MNEKEKSLKQLETLTDILYLEDEKIVSEIKYVILMKHPFPKLLMH
jgi:hypothetical protein